MSKITFEGKEIYRLPESLKKEMDSVFFMSIHKSGSTMLNNIIKDICSHLDLTFVDIPSFFFNNGIQDIHIPKSTRNIFKPKGYVYAGFRYLPHQFDIPCLDTCKVIILIRDPRDAVVSHYFSLAKSHPLPGENFSKASRENMIKQREEVLGMDINDFCLKNIQGFINKISKYDALLDKHPNIRVFQYEEIIYLKKKWIIRMMNYLGWSLPGNVATNIAKKHNQFPNKEEQEKHIRQVHPYNFNKKLDASVVQEINKKYQKILRKYHYL